MFPIGAGGRGLEGGGGRHRPGGFLRGDQGVADAGLHDIGVFDVTDRTRGLANQGGNAVVLRAANTDRPFNGVIGADVLLPLGVSDREVRGEEEGGAGTIRTVNDSDRQGRQSQTGVPLGDGRIIPHGDLAEEDVGQNGARQLQLAGGYARDIDGRHNAANNGRELVEAVFVLLFEGQRLVSGAEIDRLGLDLLDAAAGTDGLEVELVAGGALVAFSPLGVERRREGGASARDRVGGHSGRTERSGHHGSGHGDFQKLEHSYLLGKGCVRAVLKVYRLFTTVLLQPAEFKKTWHAKAGRDCSTAC